MLNYFFDKLRFAMMRWNSRLADGINYHLGLPASIVAWYPMRPYKGEMSEWLKEHAWKVCVR
jgi:hypothetical protein